MQRSRVEIAAVLVWGGEEVEWEADGSRGSGVDARRGGQIVATGCRVSLASRCCCCVGFLLRWLALLLLTGPGLGWQRFG